MAVGLWASKTDARSSAACCGVRRVQKYLSVFQPMPQVLRNVRYRNGSPLELDPVKHAIRAAELKLGSTGRLLVRKSGTETLIRVMAEGEDEARVAEVVGDVVGEIERALQ